MNIGEIASYPNFDSNKMDSENKSKSGTSNIFQINSSEIPYDVRIAIIISFIGVFLISIILNIPAIERIKKV